ncbi:[Acyl-carrier-protein] S-malonyltransferase [Sulfidibacter corallicola]|uniref:[acyl-carrier-protein] S-malonyltransferase n=1 Tax=Sulfidibacter corallicola TaxID=2818388 RepID=A0A8A4TNS1_SULCO|nr:ACP S-malonyltransferase [Sulfidibacter corallicola]QTD51200.1 ACP S-malonyltransferase [Sulfidibacter corallicola]
MIAYLFPGQGSQTRGMGAALFASFPQIVAQADRILGYSIEELCCHDPHKQLNRTDYTQPALYVVNALTYFSKIRHDPKPDFVAGHSLGEYNALLAAEVFDFETGLRLVSERGRLMAQADGGGMAAVIGSSREQVTALVEEHGEGRIDIANDNAPKQTVISGPADLINRLREPFEAGGVPRYVPLRVTAAFHSRYMAEAAETFAAFLQGFTFAAPKIPVIANVHGRPYRTDEIAANLAHQIRDSVRWRDSMRYLMAKGVEEVQEMGPGRVLQGLWRAVNLDAKPLTAHELQRLETNATVGATAPAATPAAARTAVSLAPPMTAQAAAPPVNRATTSTVGRHGIAASPPPVSDPPSRRYRDFDANEPERRETWSLHARSNPLDTSNRIDHLGTAGEQERMSGQGATHSILSQPTFVPPLDGASQGLADQGQSFIRHNAVNGPGDTLAPPPVTPKAAPGGVSSMGIRPERLGCAEFRRDYGVRLAYVSGSMYKGIASKEMVVRMGRAGLLGFMGTGGLSPQRVAQDLLYIKQHLDPSRTFGMNLLNNLDQPQREAELVDLFLEHEVRNVEASAFMGLSAPLVRYRFHGAYRDRTGQAVAVNRVIAKVSRPEVARQFLAPPPQKLLAELVAAGSLSQAEAEAARSLPVCQDVCVEADSGGHTDMGVAAALIPTMLRLRDEAMAAHGYKHKIRVGAAGGIGTPEAAAAALVLGADFVLTGSINQCTPEAGTSERVKDLLQQAEVQDTDYAPAGDMFEFGAKVQVLKRGIFFPARAQKLYELYRRHGGLAEIDANTQRTMQEKYFRRSFEEVWEETRAYYSRHRPQDLEKAERHPRHKMVLIFKWYFIYSTRCAMKGTNDKVNYQIHCGPAMGSFNQFVKGTPLADWRHRHVDHLADHLMNQTAELLTQRTKSLLAMG